MGQRVWRYKVLGLFVGVIILINSWLQMGRPYMEDISIFPGLIDEAFASVEFQLTQNSCNPIKKRASSAIALTSDGNFLLVVNPDSNSLTIIDLLKSNLVSEINVGLDPRTVSVDDCGERAFVANRGSDSVSVVDIQGKQIISEIVVGDRPYGVILSPDNRYLYVAESGEDRLRVIDTQTFETLSSHYLPDKPSGLAITDDGQSLFVTHLLNGQISLINLNRKVIYLPITHLDSLQPTLVTKRDKPATFSYSPSNLIKSTSLFPDSNLSQ